MSVRDAYLSEVREAGLGKWCGAGRRVNKYRLARLLHREAAHKNRGPSGLTPTARHVV
jgi:hypothetical protein